MSKHILTDKELLALIEKHRDTPGIVHGIVQEHRSRGGHIPLGVALGLSDTLDWFD